MFLSALAENVIGMDFWNYVGYLASLLVFISMTMTSVVKLRCVSIVGSTLFSIYGFMIGSFPTGVMNAGVVCANIYFLLHMKRDEELFTAHRIRLDNDFVKDFIMYNGRDIQKNFSGFTYGSTDANFAIMTYCNLTAAGLLIGKDDGNGTLHIDMDYTTAQYRDCRVGKFLFRKLKKLGFTKLTMVGENQSHIAYLESMGFKLEGDRYIKNL